MEQFLYAAVTARRNEDLHICSPHKVWVSIVSSNAEQMSLIQFSTCVPSMDVTYTFDVSGFSRISRIPSFFSTGFKCFSVVDFITPPPAKSRRIGCHAGAQRQRGCIGKGRGAEQLSPP